MGTGTSGYRATGGCPGVRVPGGCLGRLDECLYEYLERNKAYLVHYEERNKEHKTYTSQVAESHIESIINARHNKSGKMQWTRAGAHKVLHIRGTIASNE